MITSFLIPSLIKWVAGATLVSKHIDDKFLNENKDKASENLTSQSKQSNKSYLFRNVKTGFELIIKGVNEQNTDSLINIKEGIYCLKNIYSEEQELMSNIISYYRFTEKPDIQLFIQKLFRIEKYIKFLILENSYEEFVKNYLSQKETSVEDFKKKIESIYSVLINDKNNRKNNDEKGESKINCYLDLLDESGKIYNDLISYYLKLSLVPDIAYNHELVYEMAEIILHETDFYFCRDLRQKQLAEDITNHIFKHIHGESQANKLIEQKNEDFQTNENVIYKHYLGFNIKTYPYYLNICSVIYRELVKYNIGIAKNDEDKEEVTVETKIFPNMIATLYKEKYDFMQGLSEEQFERDVKQTYLANKKRQYINEILS